MGQLVQTRNAYVERPAAGQQLEQLRRQTDAQFEPVVEANATLALLAANGELGFRATVVPLDRDGAPLVSKQCREVLGVGGGDRVHVTPLP